MAITSMGNVPSGYTSGSGVSFVRWKNPLSVFTASKGRMESAVPLMGEISRLFFARGARMDVDDEAVATSVPVLEVEIFEAREIAQPLREIFMTTHHQHEIPNNWLLISFARSYENASTCLPCPYLQRPNARFTTHI